jgi:hypothetical protein
MSKMKDLLVELDDLRRQVQKLESELALERAKAGPSSVTFADEVLDALKRSAPLLVDAAVREVEQLRGKRPSKDDVLKGWRRNDLTFIQALTGLMEAGLTSEQANEELGL